MPYPVEFTLFFPTLPPGVYHPKGYIGPFPVSSQKDYDVKKGWDKLVILTKNVKHHSSWTSLTILYHREFLTVILLNSSFPPS